jgi:SAM-dependent methyltransferase
VETTIEWRPSVKHILRAATVAHMTAGWNPGSFVEMGAGTGTLTREFTNRGFTGMAYDPGEIARRHLRQSFADRQLRVVEKLEDIPAGAADYLLAFEVLEHIPDDAPALLSWTAKLHNGGQVLISVPAHQRKFGASDRRVGHVRRYERSDVVNLLESCGYQEVRVVNYGFPLGNITRWASIAFDRANEPGDEAELLSRGVDSGIRQPRAVNKVSRIATSRNLRPFTSTQRWFYSRDWGDGYVATGRLGRLRP